MAIGSKKRLRRLEQRVKELEAKVEQLEKRTNESRAFQVCSWLLVLLEIVVAVIAIVTEIVG